MLKGTCEPSRLLDLTENFVVFMDIEGGTAKILAKNHQYLGVSNAMGAYALTDKATWINFANRADLAIMLPAAPALLNQYSIIAVNPTLHPHVKAKAARAVMDWLTGPEGQAAIAAYRLAGQQLFFPNAEPARND